MAKIKDLNVFEVHNKIYTVAERAREESDVRMIPYTIKQYIDKVDNGDIRRDALIQRTDDQWVKKQKSKLIEAVLHNRPIGNIALAKGRAESKNYAITSLVDGLQRTTALVDFYHDKFALDKTAKPVVCRCVDEDGNVEKFEIEIASKKYSQLPDALKAFFDEYKLTAYMHEGFTDEELDDMVFCMNNGKTPNSYQKIRFLLGSENMRMLQPICDSTLWEEVKGCKAKNDSILCCVVRTLMMITYYNYNNLGSAAMTKFAEIDFEEYATPEIINQLAELVDELAEIKYHISDTNLDKFNSITIPHYIMALKTFKMKKNNNYDFIDFLEKFWNSELYQSFIANCESNGSGGSLYSADSVEDRQYDVDNFIDEYFDDNTGDINDNGDEANECDSEVEVITGETQTASTCDTGNSKAEICVEVRDNDIGVVQTDSNSCGETSHVRQEEQIFTSNLSGSKQAVESA